MTGRQTRAAQRAAMTRADLPLVGRKKELADLRRLYAEGVGWVTITGPEGIGKTRLAHAVVEELPHVRLVDDATTADVATVDGPIVATARNPLGIEGERAYRLRPLARSPAAELYRRAAEAVDPAFDVPYGELVERARPLGGIPAAIEAAARGSSGH